MIYPSQVTRLRDFFDDLLSAHERARKEKENRGGSRYLFCAREVDELLQRAERLGEMLKSEAAYPQREVGRACVFSEIT